MSFRYKTKVKPSRFFCRVLNELAERSTFLELRPAFEFSENQGKIPWRIRAKYISADADLQGNSAPYDPMRNEAERVYIGSISAALSVLLEKRRLDAWVAYRVCDTRRYQTPVMGNVRKYWTHFVLCLFVRIYIDLAFAKFAVKLQQSSLSLLLSTTIVAEWKIINDSDTVGWISKTYLSFASFSKLALFFVNVSGC